jgi:hypothetical protein
MNRDDVLQEAIDAIDALNNRPPEGLHAIQHLEPHEVIALCMVSVRALMSPDGARRSREQEDNEPKGDASWSRQRTWCP